MHVPRAGPDVDNANSTLLASSFIKRSCYTLDYFHILMGGMTGMCLNTLWLLTLTKCNPKVEQFFSYLMY